jgi:hypothetical protein
VKRADGQPGLDRERLVGGQPSGRVPARLKQSWPILVVSVIIPVFFSKLIFSNLILTRGDTFLYFYPYWQAAADALRAGQLPLWNPHLFMGAPFLANSQAGVFYPLNWPLWLLLPAPYAVNASIVVHLVIAALGTYLAARRVLDLGRLAAVLVAVLFSLGGYLTAQVEHVNQLQGLAWLPWCLVVLDGRLTGPSFRAARLIGMTAGLAALLSLQLLAGHTQTTFITGVGLLAWLVASWLWPTDRSWEVDGAARERRTPPWSRLAILLAPLVIGGTLALLLTAVQLLPTLELAGYSSRQGGLPVNEGLSFSLHPLLLSRALLPGYGQSLFSEYVAFIPLTALLLAVIGGWQAWEQPRLRPVVLLAALGLFLALGQFNPLYHVLARLPGFNLFRVPARWLALYGLAVAMLAGQGLQVFLRQGARSTAAGDRAQERDLVRPLRTGLLGLLALMIWSVLAVWLGRYVPVGPESPAELPDYWTWAGWLVELGLLWLIIGPGRRLMAGRSGRGIGLAVSAILVPALFLASRSLPYNRPTTPEAYFDLRPSLARLQAAAVDCHQPLADCQAPPGRFLSLSEIFFDPGDQAEIDAIYADQLLPEARYDYIIAIKQKEIIAPNLPLAYGLAAVDGFDGGILPLRDYTAVTRLILPPGRVTTDGRLREQLAAVPEARWLDLFNVEYVITDKVGDVWQPVGPPEAGYTAYFDLQHRLVLQAGEGAAVGYVPEFPATALYLALAGPPGRVQVEDQDGRSWELTPEPYSRSAADDTAPDLYRVPWPEGRPLAVTAITVRAAAGAPWEIRALTLVNEEDGTFQSLVPGAFRLIHSGDVKIYHNLDVLPRAFLVDEWLYRPTVDAAVAAMADPEFDPARQAVVVADGPERRLASGEMAGQPVDQADVSFLDYEPERVSLVVSNPGPDDRLLLLTDTHYPGWKSAIDGQPATIYQADGLFRGVVVPAGEHQVTFSFQPTSYRVGRWLSLAGLLVWGLTIVVAFLIKNKSTGRRAAGQ